MINNHPPTDRDAGNWARQVLARASAHRRTALAVKGRQTRRRIHLLVACKLALITAALVME